MNAVDHFKTSFVKINHSHGKKVSGGRLYRGLKDTTTNERVAAPVAGEGVLPVNGDSVSVITPRGWEQLNLWSLPTDPSTAR